MKVKAELITDHEAATVNGPRTPTKTFTQRIYLLSPANAAGVRGRMLLNSASGFELARRFQSEGART
jgi:hypothetical protein